MKCEKCGAEFEGNFCNNCGTPAADKKNAQERSGYKVFFAIIAMAAVVYFVVSFSMSYQEVKEKSPEELAEDREQDIMVTATIALDRYAPGTDYPETLVGWIVTEHSDSTISASSYGDNGDILVMLIENPESPGNFFPYYVKVGQRTFIDLTAYVEEANINSSNAS